MSDVGGPANDNKARHEMTPAELEDADRQIHRAKLTRLMRRVLALPPGPWDRLEIMQYIIAEDNRALHHPSLGAV